MLDVIAEHRGDLIALLAHHVRVDISEILAGIHAGLKGLHLRLDFAEAGNASHRILEQRLFRELRLGMLPRGADGRRTLYDQFAVVGRQFAEDNPEKRGLAASIRAHHADPLSLVHSERNVG